MNFLTHLERATLAAFKQLRKDGWIKDGETVVLFNTGSGQKYYHLWDNGWASPAARMRRESLRLQS